MRIRALITLAVSTLALYTLYAYLLTPTLEVLLEAPLNKHRRLKNSVLLTVDLTKAVADEAIARGDSIIIAYRKFNA